MRAPAPAAGLGPAAVADTFLQPVNSSLSAKKYAFLLKFMEHQVDLEFANLVYAVPGGGPKSV